MIQTPTKKSLAQQWAWIAPIAAFLLLVAGAWFLVWFWRGGSSANTEAALTTEARQALNASQGAPSPMAAPRPRLMGLGVPPLQIPGKGHVITQFRDANGSGWAVIAGPYQMSVVQHQGSTDFEYHFAVRNDAAFAGPDRALMSLGVQLVFNPLDKQHSGAPDALINQLRTQFNGGRDLISPPLAVADSDAKDVETLWQQYVKSTSATRIPNGTQLLDSLIATGKKSVAADHDLFAKMVANVRQLIPTDQEQQYRTAIRNANAPPPPPRVTTPSPAATPAGGPSTQP